MGSPSLAQSVPAQLSAEMVFATIRRFAHVSPASRPVDVEEEYTEPRASKKAPVVVSAGACEALFCPRHERLGGSEVTRLQALRCAPEQRHRLVDRYALLDGGAGERVVGCREGGEHGVEVFEAVVAAVGR